MVEIVLFSFTNYENHSVPNMVYPAKLVSKSCFNNGQEETDE